MNKEPTHSPFAELIDSMNNDGLATEASKLSYLLRDVAWTSGSEFQGEFGLAMKTIKLSSWSSMSEKTKSGFNSVASIILETWPEIGL